MKKYFIAVLAAILMVLLSTQPGMAHAGGKAKPKVRITKSASSDLRRDYVITLNDSDGTEVLSDAKVSLSAKMTTPHVMEIKLIQLKEASPGVYKAAVQYPMAAKWQVSINITGAKIIQTKSTFEEDITLKPVPGKKPRSSTPVQAKTKVRISLNWLTMIVAVLHLLFAVLYVGSHAFVVLALRPFAIEPPSAQFWPLLMRRYSAIAGISLVLLIATGVYNAIFNVPVPLAAISAKPFGTLYLTLLVIKIVLVVLALLVGTYSATVIAPNLGKGSNSKKILVVSTINFTLGVGIIVIAAVLGYLHKIIHIA